MMSRMICCSVDDLEVQHTSFKGISGGIYSS